MGIYLNATVKNYKISINCIIIAVNMSHCTSSTVIAGDKPGKERHTGGFSSDEGEEDPNLPNQAPIEASV